MKNVQAAYLKERCELLLEQIEDCKKAGNTDTQMYRDLQQSYIRNSQAYVAVMNVDIERKMRELGVQRPKNPKPLSEEQLRGLGLSEQTISFMKGVGVGKQEG